MTNPPRRSATSQGQHNTGELSAYGQMDVVTLGDFTSGEGTFEPGLRWSEDVKRHSDRTRAGRRDGWRWAVRDVRLRRCGVRLAAVGPAGRQLGKGASMSDVRSLDRSDLESRVKQMYERVAESPEADFHFETGRGLAEHLGYPSAHLDAVPEAAIDSFAGVGYFLDLAAIEAGDRVLDLGSGSGMDSFLAAQATGPTGHVTGVDMTKAQLDKATRLAVEAGFEQVEFRNGYIEEPAVDDGTYDVVISNGVINLSPDKPAVFRAAAAALRPGGRLAIADIVSARQLPEGVTCDASLWAACIGGAAQRDDYLVAIQYAGFEIDVVRDNDYRFISDQALGATTTYGVTSISLLATKR